MSRPTTLVSQSRPPGRPRNPDRRPPGPRPGHGRCGHGEQLSPEELTRQAVALLEYVHPRTMSGAALQDALACKSYQWPIIRDGLVAHPEVETSRGRVGEGLTVYRWAGGGR